MDSLLRWLSGFALFAALFAVLFAVLFALDFSLASLNRCCSGYITTMSDKSPFENRSSAKSPFEQLNEQVAETLNTATRPLILGLQELLERGTETVGQVVTPIAEHPITQFATRVPGLRWFMAALGQVNVEKVEQDVAILRQQYPLETTAQLAQRIIADTALKAAGAGLITNIVPPLAVTLLAIDIAAVTALQAAMVYRIAAVYGFSVHEPTRRGEVLALWGLSMGGSGMLKTGLSLVEAIPLIGTGVGIASNAALLYSLGYVAQQFYEAKREAIGRSTATQPIKNTTGSTPAGSSVNSSPVSSSANQDRA